MHLSGESYRSAAAGVEIHRQLFTPDGGEALGSVLMLHGLGDHMGCHFRAADLFCERGYLAAGVDWPGHGRSGGKRGHIRGLKAVFGLVDELLAWLRDQELGPGPRGVYAHSTGAFVLLHYLRQRLIEQGNPGEPVPFDWIWLGSPLLRPDHGQPPLLVMAGRWLAVLAPSLTLDTKVRADRCRHPNPEGFNASRDMDGCHHWVNAHFGGDLVRHAGRSNDAAAAIGDPVRLLLTQGAEDGICPPEFSRDFFDRVPAEDKTYVLLPGMRHEVLREPGNEDAIGSIADWLDVTREMSLAES